MIETLAELDKQHITKQVLAKLAGKPIKKLSPGFEPMVYIKDGIDKKLPSALPAIAVQHLGHIDNDLNGIEQHIQIKLDNPKVEFLLNLQAFFKKKNIFDMLDLRTDPALHALDRLNYPHSRRFKHDYGKLYRLADGLKNDAKGLGPLKNQCAQTRAHYDEVLSSRAIELISEMRELCDAFLNQVRFDYKLI